MRIKDARKAQRYTMADVASYLGVSTPTYSRMEKYPEVITISDAKKLAELFRVDVNEIFFAENYK